MAAQKFYGVKVGRKPGIYTSWNECKQQVHAYPGALYKSFPTKEQALVYLDGATEQTAQSNKHGQSSLHNYDGNYYNIYVDGSYANSSKRFSWAFVVYDGDQIIHTASGLGQDTDAAAIHNVAGELEAAVQAMQWAQLQPVDFVVIHHDYIGISEWACGRWKTNNKFTKAYADFAAAHLDKVKFHKVSGHSGIAGNELADQLAGKVLREYSGEQV